MKRYLHEKIAYIESETTEDEHVLIVPGKQTETTRTGRTCVYAIAAPLVSRTTRYRALLNLRAVDEVIECEQPDLIECADPYQLGWKAAAVGRSRQIPVIGFYHSDFPQAYLRKPAARFGTRAAQTIINVAHAYRRALYNRFAMTLVPSPEVAAQLSASGIRNVREVDLGVNINVFTPHVDDRRVTRAAYAISDDAKLLLYVGRLAGEKNTQTLLGAFARLAQRAPGAFHLLVVGDGQERAPLQELVARTGAVTWLPFADSAQLAQLYRAADLFVHPGMQETFGLVALESQACGTPIVGIRGSAMDRIILHDQESWACEDSPEALAEAIARSAARDLQPMGRTAAKAVTERYAWRKVFERLFCIYRDVQANYSR